jgi:hypothetical protein
LIPPRTDVNISAKVIITAYTDGRPIGVQATCDPLNALRLIAAAINNAAQVIESQTIPQGQADPVDKERKYLGPRKD